MQSDVRHVLLPSENAAWPDMESTCANSQLHIPSSFHSPFFFSFPLLSPLRQGSTGSGRCEAALCREPARRTRRTLGTTWKKHAWGKRAWKMEGSRKDWQKVRARRLGLRGRQKENTGAARAKLVWRQVETSWVQDESCWAERCFGWVWTAPGQS